MTRLDLLYIKQKNTHREILNKLLVIVLNHIIIITQKEFIVPHILKKLVKS